MSTVKKVLSSSAVPILFTVICIIGILLSGTPLSTILADVVNRFDRNFLLVLSLIIPVICGLGMNFGIVLGAMCGQLGLVVVKILNISGMPAILVAAAIAFAAAIVCGNLAGRLLNHAKGQEMITSMILGYFSNGIYQFIFLFIIGGVIKVSSDIILQGGVGIKNTIDLSDIQYALDDFKIAGFGGRMELFSGIQFFSVLFFAYYGFAAFRNKNKRSLVKAIGCAAVFVAAYFLSMMPQFAVARMLIRIPVPTLLFDIFICWLLTRFIQTKMGQDMRAIGHDREVSLSAGINVDKTRITAVVISTVLAAWGQIIFYQNLGTMDAYYGHEKVGTFCVAAILIGGASVKKASISQAVLGTVLFHLLYNVSPLASQHLFHDSTVGGYFRLALCYGVIAIALMIHVWDSEKQSKALQEATDRKVGPAESIKQTEE